MLEIINAFRPPQTPKAAVFDFDGTISVLREGWVEILSNYFIALLQKTPKGRTESRDNLLKLVLRSLEANIGKLPMFQIDTLIDLLHQFGQPVTETPEFYLNDYYQELFALVAGRHQQLRQGRSPDDFMLPGTVDVLKMFQRHGVKVYIASGTEQQYVRQDCELLQITGYFDGIFGGTDDLIASSKHSIIARILRENSIRGSELIGFGDGQTETKEVKAVGGLAVGVASNEDTRQGINEWKRQQLTDADWIIPHFGGTEELEQAVFSR